MTTVADILKYVETLAPTYMKMDWDNVGLLCGSRETPVTKVLVALDPFEGVCREAVEWGAELIVTHHPIIFDPLKSVTEETTVGRSIMTLCRHGPQRRQCPHQSGLCPGGRQRRAGGYAGTERRGDHPALFPGRSGAAVGPSAPGQGRGAAPFPISGNR